MRQALFHFLSALTAARGVLGSFSGMWNKFYFLASKIDILNNSLYLRLFLCILYFFLVILFLSPAFLLYPSVN